MNKQKGISTILSILLVVLVIAGGVIVYNHYYTSEEKPSDGETPGETQDETADWKTYRNPEASFTFKYPSDWEVKQDSPVTQIIGLKKNNNSIIADLFLKPVFAQTQIPVPEGTISLPDGFEIKTDYLYETAAGYKAHSRTIIIGPIDNSEGIIFLNMHQFSCHGFPQWPNGAFRYENSQNFRWLPPFHKIKGTDTIVGENYIATCYTARAVLDIFDEIIKSFEVVSKLDIYLPENYSFDKQQVGEPTDGQGLNLIRHADHGNYYRFVFDITDQYGSEEDYIVVPSAEAFYAHSAKTIGLIINGIRRDLTNNQVGKPIMVNDEVVTSYVHDKVYDDQAIGYTIGLNKDAKFYLHALTDPVRIILDIEK